MKRLLFILTLILCTLTISAQTYRYRASSFAFAKVYNGQHYWGDWEKSSVDIYISLDKEQVYVSTQEAQLYSITSCSDWKSDGMGGRVLEMKVIDQDRDRGTITLRVESSGSQQLYVQ